ncbi:ankyrin repeat domain-containing protein [Candidatus Dependentiae bacterium]|nr:ankyrin repeat domain-containing protein [Candidatus Dependentiae bacterium]
MNYLLFIFSILLTVAKTTYGNQVADEKLQEGLTLGNRQQVEEALKEGANPSGILNHPFHGNFTMLTWILENEIDIIVSEKVMLVHLLLDYGSNVNVKNRTGQTILHIAIMRGDKGLVQRIISLGTYINMQDRAGCTPLMIAARNGYKDIVELLLSLGAHPMLRMNDGKTAFDLAQPRTERVQGEHLFEKQRQQNIVEQDFKSIQTIIKQYEQTGYLGLSILVGYTPLDIPILPKDILNSIAYYIGLKIRRPL